MKITKRMRPLLGTFVELAVLSDLPQTKLEPVIQSSFTQIELIQQLLGFHNPTSDLSRLNRAQGDWVECHPLTVKCLRLAQAITRVSCGKFNCTLGYATVIQGALPAQNFHQLYADRLLPFGSWQDLQIQTRRVRLLRPLLITLDGIGKGFAIDIAINKLKRFGIDAGWINAGGDIRVFGDIALPVSVRDHNDHEHNLGAIRQAAIATSTSIYSRETPGILLDSLGQPQPPATWTVISSSAWRADALTKVVAALDSHEREKVMHTLGGRWIALA